jgi:hypothetical protein
MTNVQRAQTNGLGELDKTDSAFTQPHNNDGQYFGIVLSEALNEENGASRSQSGLSEGWHKPGRRNFLLGGAQPQLE